MTTLFATMLTAPGVSPLVWLILAILALYLLARLRLVPFGLSFETNDPVLKYLIDVGLLDSAGGLKLRIKAKTADYTIVTGTDPSGTIFTNRAATGAVNFTLPAPSQAIRGTFYEFLGIADQNIVVLTATADTLVVVNDVAADSLAIQTSAHKIGAHMRVVCDGTAWAAYGDSVGDTFTVAT